MLRAFAISAWQTGSMEEQATAVAREDGEAAFARAEAATRRSRPPSDTLRRVLGLFFGAPSTRCIVLAMLVSAALRSGAGSLTLREVALMAAVFVAWPLVEWSAHRWLLHIRPRRIGGLQFDPYFARRHRQHHMNPSDYPLVFLPVRVVAGAYAVFSALLFLASSDRALTFGVMAAISTAALVYEWHHFIAHTDYAPKNRWQAEVVRRHRLHHYKSERRWYGFTVPAVDDWFGTGGAAADTERSGTTRTLGVE